MARSPLRTSCEPHCRFTRFLNLEIEFADAPRPSRCQGARIDKVQAVVLFNVADIIMCEEAEPSLPIASLPEVMGRKNSRPPVSCRIKLWKDATAPPRMEDILPKNDLKAYKCSPRCSDPCRSRESRMLYVVEEEGGRVCTLDDDGVRARHTEIGEATKKVL